VPDAGRRFVTRSALRITADDPRFAQAAALRHEVLRAPLGIDDPGDWHDADPGVVHAVVVDDGVVLGYGRLVTGSGETRIRHMAVRESARGTGVGAAVMRELIAAAEERGASVVVLDARLPAVGFYERLGFTAEGPVFDSVETGVPHRRMTRAL
jgi:predicted GNAT family N-acyltransferase